MPLDALPLRRPPAWNASQHPGRWTVPFGIVLILAGVGLGILVITQDRTEHAPLFAVAAGGGVFAWGLVILGMAFPPPPQPPMLVNAVAVTPGDERPPDDWVHLFRRRRMTRAFAIGVAALSAYMFTIVGGTVWLVLDGTEDSGLLLWLGIPVLSAVGIGIYAIREALSRRRLSTFGRPPTGLTVGESGITLLDPHRTRFIPWESVVRVAAKNARTRGGEARHFPLLELVIPGENVEVQLARYVATPHVVYSAVVTAVEDAAFRSALGTSGAQAVLERWSADAAAWRRTVDDPRAARG